MRVALPILLVTLLVAGGVRAQTEAPATSSPGVPVPVCYVLVTPYGVAPVCTTSMVDPVEVERSQADYFTNGASFMAVPSEGPRAAYFHDGASVLAAATAPPTASIQPAAPAASSAPAVPAASSAPEPAAVAVAPVPSVSAEPPAETAAPTPTAEATQEAPPTPATASWAVDQATTSAMPEPSATSSTTPVGMREHPSPLLLPPSTSHVQPRATSERAGEGPTAVSDHEPAWAVVLAGGAIGAGVLYLLGCLVRQRRPGRNDDGRRHERDGRLAPAKQRLP